MPAGHVGALAVSYLDEYLQRERARKEAGIVHGRHYSAYAPEVRQALRSGDEDVAAGLLIQLVAAVEREAQFPMPGLGASTPWYHEHLAAIYRRQGRNDLASHLMQRYQLAAVAADREARLLLLRQREQLLAEFPPEAPHAELSPPPKPWAIKLGRLAGRLVRAGIDKATGR